MRTEDVVIVGCGPAGVAAAIQLKRSGIEPVVFEKGNIGGLVVNAHLVENYPGFPDGIAGPDLAGLMQAHLERLSVAVRHEEVARADLARDGFEVESSGGTMRTRRLIIAPGTQARKLPSLRISGDLAEKVLYEVFPIRDVSRRQVVIIGAGDAAFDYALTIERRNHVTIVNRGTRRRCLDLLWRRTQASGHICYLENTEVTRVVAGPGGRVRLQCTGERGPEEIQADYLIIAVGREPALGFVSQRLAEAADAMQANGLLHIAGDAKNGGARQTAIAVGDGLAAAMRISNLHRGTDT
jgi:thioredoxin reductase (NADPH)